MVTSSDSGSTAASAYTIGFCLLVLLIGVALSLLADLIGTRSTNPEATTPLLMGPQLIFGLLSVGIQPAEQFPEWIQPIVRNQPISQFVYALRALAGDTTDAAGAVTWSVMGPTVAVVARLARDPGADVGRGSGKAAVMSVAHQEAQSGWRCWTTGRVAEPTHRYSENSPRRTGSADARSDEATTRPVEPRPDDGHRDARRADSCCC